MVTAILMMLLGVIIGGIITWLVSLHYYIQAAKDLSNESNHLRHLAHLMLRGMEAAGWVEYNRDEKGNPVGIVFKASIAEIAHTSDEADATVISSSSEDKDV